MDIKVELSKDDFAYFKAECRYWLDRFGMNDWEVIYLFGMPDNDAMAGTNGNYVSRRATIHLNPILDSDDILAMDKTEILRLSAQHEVLELVMLPVQILAKCRDFDEETFTSENHAVIHRIARALKDSGRDVLREAMAIKKETKCKPCGGNRGGMTYAQNNAILMEAMKLKGK